MLAFWEWLKRPVVVDPDGLLIDNEYFCIISVVAKYVEEIQIDLLTLIFAFSEIDHFYFVAESMCSQSQHNTAFKFDGTFHL